MAALQIKNIPTGAGDDIKFDVSYAKGDTMNVIAVSGTSPSFAMFGGSGSAIKALGATTDGVYFPGAGGTGVSSLRRLGVSAVRSTTTGIHTGRAAYSEATPAYGMTVERTTTSRGWEPPPPRGPIVPPSPQAIRARQWSEMPPAHIPAIRISTSPSLAWSPAGLRSRT